MFTLKHIFRTIQKFKYYSGLNILGLSLGLTCVILISIWIFNELGYDKFHENYNRIYQINYKTPEGERSAGSPAPLAPAISEEVAGIKNTARLFQLPELAFKYEDKMFYEDNGISADPDMFKMFSFKEVRGDPVEALSKINSIIITRSFAHKYFGNEDPIDKEIMMEGRVSMTVNAVIEDAPAQSHIQFDYIFPHKFIETYRFAGLGWEDPNFHTYVQIVDQTNIQSAIEAITKVSVNNDHPHVKYSEWQTLLRPIGDIYLDHEIHYTFGVSGDRRYLYIFGSIALLILILACINYINLTVSLFARRKKASAIKKVCGAKKKTIFRHYFAETFFFTAISSGLAFLAACYLKNSMDDLFGKELGSILPEPAFLLCIGLVFLITTVACAIYPALLFSGSGIIKSLNRNDKQKSGILRSMVIVQNIIAIVLIASTLGVIHQLNFIRDKKLGFNSEQVVYINLRGNIGTKIELVKNQLLSYGGITGLAMKDCVPYSGRNFTVAVSWFKDGKWQNDNKQELITMETTRVDENYFDLMKVEFVDGRNFSSEITSDKNHYIVNETAASKMGFDQPVGKSFMLYGRKGKIIGVIKDTYFKSLHEKIKPQVFYLYQDAARQSYRSSLFMKLKPNDIEGSIRHIGKIWRQHNPNIPFEYHFLDSDYEKLYRSDSRISLLMKIFTGIAIFIACLGLLGQISITVENRIKEIGIRKVNGAKVFQVMTLLNKNFILWVVLACIIAMPLSFYLLSKWLQNFAYKTQLSWWIFALAGVVALGIALLTVSWQSWRAARRNPVESLRYE